MHATLANILDRNLPDIITEIASRNNINEYVTNPDFADPRLASWHEFGLLTHTREVRKAFKENIPLILADIGIYDNVQRALQKTTIDGLTKNELLEAAIIVHDLGKITALGNTSHDRDHEEMSVRLLNEEPLSSTLDFHLLIDEKKYITRCVSTHDVLGEQVRDVLKHEDNLTLAYVNAGGAAPLINKVINTYPDVRLEIGLFFACDTLGKISLRLDALDDTQIAAYEPYIEHTLREKKLNPSLKKAVMQYPVTMQLARLYLDSIKPYLSSS